MKGRRLRTLLETRLGYSVVRTAGSHRIMTSHERPRITLAIADGKTIGPNLVWKILRQQVMLSEEEAWEVIRHV